MCVGTRSREATAMSVFCFKVEEFSLSLFLVTSQSVSRQYCHRCHCHCGNFSQGRFRYDRFPGSPRKVAADIVVSCALSPSCPQGPSYLLLMRYSTCNCFSPEATTDLWSWWEAQEKVQVLMGRDTSYHDYRHITL